LRTWIPAIAFALLLLPAEAQTFTEAGSKKKPQLRWSELGAVVTGQKIAIAAPEGLLEGRVAGVEEDTLRLQTKKGEVRIPRASITTLELRQMRKSGRIIGTAVGAAVGFGGAVAIEIAACLPGAFSLNPCSAHGGADAAAVAVGIGLPVGGFFLGKWADGKNTLITILRDTP